MWVFGYGSLMWDNWERGHNCLRRTGATLYGYSRTFNKLSVVNWGNKQNPGPTLNLMPQPLGVCTGVAFHFGDDMENQVKRYLERREGQNFRLTNLAVALTDGEIVHALIPLYTGKNIVSTNELSELASMVITAQGSKGRCFDYVKGIADELARINISDVSVSELWAEVQIMSQSYKLPRNL